MGRDPTAEGQGEQRDPAGSDDPRRKERARAAAYLDLWERHVGLMAIQGPAPPPRREA